MTVGSLVVRAGVSPGGDISHLITRGLDSAIPGASGFRVIRAGVSPDGSIPYTILRGLTVDSTPVPTPGTRGRYLPPSLGLPVTSRDFSFYAMVTEAWGGEFSAPDHRIYQFSNGRAFDSTDRGETGFYKRS